MLVPLAGTQPSADAGEGPLLPLWEQVEVGLGTRPVTHVFKHSKDARVNMGTGKLLPGRALCPTWAEGLSLPVRACPRPGTLL